MSKSGSDQRVLVYAYSKQYNAVRHALAVRRDERTIVISHVPHMVSERTVHKWLVADDDGDDEYIAVSVVDENVATNDDFNPVHVRSAARNVQVCLTTDALANEVWQNKLMSVEHAAALPPRIEPDCAHRVFLVHAKGTGLASARIGLAKWSREYAQRLRRTESELDAHVNEYMAQFDAAADKRATAAKKAQVPDEEGWVTVTSKRGNQQLPTLVATGLLPVTSSAHEQTMLSRSAKRKLKSRQQEAKLPFYKFQMKQTRIDQVQELRRKFDEDKRTVESMKVSRKFKPF